MNFNNLSNTIKFTIYGALFGFAFPIGATFIDFFLIKNLTLSSFTVETIVNLHINNPLHMIINSAPFVIGFTASFIGRSQDQLTKTNTNLEEQLLEREKISNQIMAVSSDLEVSVNKRTKDLEKRNTEMETFRLVARDAASMLDPQKLMDRSVKLIAEQLGYYHVGLFLIDDQNEWAVLQSVSSQGGQQMIDRGHKLQVGKKGIVGFVTGIGQSRIAQATEIDTIHSITVELPETRSEMALPLKARGEILGAIDIQHNEENAFSDADVIVLQTLADQIGLAISNAQLYQQIQESIKEIQSAYGEFSQETWKEFFRAKSIPAYKFSGGEVIAADLSDELPKTGTLSLRTNDVSVPIVVRGELIGEINIQKSESDDEAWSEKEISLIENLTDQLGVALDSAQLFQITQRRAATEQAVSDVTARIRESLDIETIIKTAAEEMQNVMDLPEVTVRLATPEMVGANSDGANPNGQEQ